MTKKHRELTHMEKDCLKYKGLCFCSETDEPVAKGGPAGGPGAGGESFRTGPCEPLLPPCGPEEAARRQERERRRQVLKAEKMAADKPPEKPLKPCWPGFKGPLKGRRM